MRMRTLGGSGLRVSPYCLGTMMFGPILDRIDEIVAPGTDVGVSEVSYVPQSLTRLDLRRRPAGARSAA